MQFFANIEGGEELRRALLKLKPQVIAAVEKPFEDQAKRLLALSQAMAPVKSGELRSSGKVSKSKRGGKSGGVLRLRVQYTDEKAAAVHEGIHWNKKVPGTRGFRFLAKAFEQVQRDIIKAVETALRSLVGGT